MGGRELFDLMMERPVSLPIPAVELPQGYSIVSIGEDNGYLWEKVMDLAFGNYEPGDFRYVIVSNNYYEEGRVFVMLDENDQPVATASSWQYDNWWNDKNHGTVIFVGVSPECRGHKFGYTMVNYVLQDIRKRGFSIATLNVEENNFSAIKTYINCGFTPQIEIPEHIEIWKEQFNKLGLIEPEYDKSLRPRNETPHPPRLWPYELCCAGAAELNGDIYVHGIWERHNMYLVDASEYCKVEPLFNTSEEALMHLDKVKRDGIGHIFINKPLNPSAAILETGDGVFHITGKNEEKRFIDGIISYFLRDIVPKYKGSSRQIKLFTSGDNWENEDFCHLIQYEILTIDLDVG